MPIVEASSMQSKKFWEQYRDQPDQRAMMLNHSAELIADSDRDDVLDALPDIADKRILELGAGIGRFTGKLASKASFVHATDFIDSFIDHNKTVHSHMDNVNFCCSDASALSFKPEKFDLIFTNWLLMYLSDLEVIGFLQRCLVWLCNNDEGYVHVRESCSEPSSKKKGDTCHQDGEENPTSYRHSSVYIRAFQSARFTDEQGHTYGFKVLWAKSIPTYVEVYQNWRQVQFLLKKVQLPCASPNGEGTNQLVSVNGTAANGHATTNGALENGHGGNRNDVFSQDDVNHKMKITWPGDQRAVDELFEKITERLSATETGLAAVDSLVQLKLGKLLKDPVPEEVKVLAINWNNSPLIRVDVHKLAQAINCVRLWCIEGDELIYRVQLSEANRVKNTAMRFIWMEKNETDKECWTAINDEFDAVVACFNIDTDTDVHNVLQAITSCALNNGAPILAVATSSMTNNGHTVESHIQKLIGKHPHLSDVSVQNVELSLTTEENELRITLPNDGDGIIGEISQPLLISAKYIK